MAISHQLLHHLIIKMSRQTTALIIIIIVLAGAIASLYFIKERPTQTTLTFSNLSILAHDGNNNLVKTGYEIWLDNLYYVNGTTSNRGAIFQQVPLNKSILIYNQNIENQQYYTDVKEINNNTNSSIYRVNLKLEEVGDLNISNTDNEVSVKTIGLYKNAKVCFSWSSHIIYVKIDFNETSKEEGMDKCYNVILNNITFPIDYNTFGNLENDYIEIHFITYDKIPNKNDEKRGEIIYEMEIV